MMRWYWESRVMVMEVPSEEPVRRSMVGSVCFGVKSWIAVRRVCSVVKSALGSVMPRVR